MSLFSQSLSSLFLPFLLQLLPGLSLARGSARGGYLVVVSMPRPGVSIIPSEDGTESTKAPYADGMPPGVCKHPVIDHTPHQARWLGVRKPLVVEMVGCLVVVVPHNDLGGGGDFPGGDAPAVNC